MNLGVDMDAVLADNCGPAVDRINKTLGTSFTIPDLTQQFWMEPVLQDYCEDPGALLAEIFSDPEFIFSLPLILSTKLALRKISSRFDQVHIVTSRPPEMLSATKGWLAHYGIAHHKVAAVKDKADYCTRSGIRYMIEDAPHHAEALANAGIRVFLIDYPYNASVAERDGLWRIHHPMEIVHHLDADLRRPRPSPSSSPSAGPGPSGSAA